MENYLYGTIPAPTNPTRVIEVKILNALNGGAGGVSGSGTLSGSGDPEGVVTGSPGQIYINLTVPALWVKATGTGNTGWSQYV